VTFVLLLLACAQREELPSGVGDSCGGDSDCPTELLCVTEAMVSWQDHMIGECHPRCSSNDDCRFESAPGGGLRRCEWCTTSERSDVEGFCMFEGCK